MRLFDHLAHLPARAFQEHGQHYRPVRDNHIVFVSVNELDRLSEDKAKEEQLNKISLDEKRFRWLFGKDPCGTAKLAVRPESSL